MNIKITTADTVNKLISAIVAVLPPIFNKTAGSNVVNTITAFCQAFKINVDQVNQMFNNTFLDCSSGTILDDLIKSYSGLKRKDDESDADYLNRHYKMVYTYNNSNSKVTQIVYDITSENPILIRAGSNRSAFWGVANSGYVESASGIAYYYNDSGAYTRFWGDGSGSDAFKAYIYLNEKPSGVVLDELCNVLNYVRAAGTTIYLVYPPFNLIEPTATSGVALGLGEFTANYSSVDYATSYYLTIATNPAFSPIEQSNVVSFTNNYTFQGLSNSANYYYKVQAVSGIFQSDFSNSVQVAMRQLSTPTTTASSGLTSGFIANWTASSGAINYSLDLSLSSGFSSLIIENATTSGVTYTFSGLSPNDYFWRVKAVNGIHISAYSSSSGTASSGSVAPEPNYVIYSKYDGTYYIPKKFPLAGGSSSDLFSPTASTSYRDLSYNAVRNKLVYWKINSGNNNIAMSDIDGSGEVMLTSNNVSGRPSMSKNGQYLYYRRTDTNHIYRLEIDTLIATQITSSSSNYGNLSAGNEDPLLLVWRDFTASQSSKAIDTTITAVLISGAGGEANLSLDDTKLAYCSASGGGTIQLRNTSDGSYISDIISGRTYTSNVAWINDDLILATYDSGGIFYLETVVVSTATRTPIDNGDIEIGSHPTIYI